MLERDYVGKYEAYSKMYKIPFDENFVFKSISFKNPPSIEEINKRYGFSLNFDQYNELINKKRRIIILKNYEIKVVIYKGNYENKENIIFDEIFRMDNINEDDLEKYLNNTMYPLLPVEYQKNIKTNEIYYKKPSEETLYKVQDYIVKGEYKNNIYKKLRSNNFNTLCIEIE